MKTKWQFKKITKKHLINACLIAIVVAIMAAFVALVAIPSVERTALKSAKEELFENYYSFPQGGLVTARNGFNGNKKNSLFHVKSALQSGADCIEVDVCFDKEGTPVIAESQEKTDDNTMPLEYLVSYISQQVDKTSNTNRHSINLHLTDAANLEKINSIIESYDMQEYCFLTGVNLNQAYYVRTATTVPFYLDYEINKSKVNNPDYISQIINDISTSGAIGINCRPDNFTTELSTILKENWYKISFYGIEDEFDVINALKFSPNQIITPDIDMTRSILMEWNANAPSSDIIPS